MSLHLRLEWEYSLINFPRTFATVHIIHRSLSESAQQLEVKYGDLRDNYAKPLMRSTIEAVSQAAPVE